MPALRRLSWLLPLPALLLLLAAGVAVRQAAGTNGITPLAVPSPSPSPEPAAFRLVVPALTRGQPGETTLAAVGDVMLARTVGERILADGAGLPFEAVAGTLLAAGITTANLECAISSQGEPVLKGFNFRAPPAAADALTAAGIDVVSLANNHILDFGPAALADTGAALDARNIGHAGAGPDASAARRPAFVTRNGLRVAFLSYVDVPLEWGGFDTRQWEATADAPGVAWLNIGEMQADVAAARRQADVVVVFMHFGFENQYVPNATQRAQAQAAIDAGAALVIGHHPHVLQPAEWYGNGLIVYSLGNFVFDGDDNPTTESAIFVASLTAAGVASYRFVPVTIDASGFPHLAAE